ncbi:predicted protein [Aspergillus terreus NIH2624]|uniref:CCHC-type domain-containing protein n=1 Tax=Aspergillus terreus (strain NIH 2624 / FGSC A1156) TaxID=341663 RepID=Q0CJ82_ASPTN|nr:uncharacterized protein ATEG_06252 [Aspergillus terreus NIH2624]EAU32796.1 predicted protein [Aspergillus terreus NIH2624]
MRGNTKGVCEGRNGHVTMANSGRFGHLRRLYMPQAQVLAERKMFNPEKIYQYYGKLNHRTNYCPNATFCIYCNREGHGIICCRRVKCRRCGAKGHHQSICKAPQVYNSNIGWAPSPAPGPSTITHLSRLSHSQGTTYPVRSSGQSPNVNTSVESRRQNAKRRKIQPFSVESPRLNAKWRKMQPFSASRNLNVTVYSSEHNEAKWLATEQDVRDLDSDKPWNMPLDYTGIVGDN